ncbi:hypothetical protein ZWY2020_040955 [Hordeum vulgare]|nr:hypothetical protein ZWY2020_040955 [Hordeum vulgare]
MPEGLASLPEVGNEDVSPPPVRNRSPRLGGVKVPTLRLGWRGPLPRPRITSPSCLGDFFPAAVVPVDVMVDNGKAAMDAGVAPVDAGADDGPDETTIEDPHNPREDDGRAIQTSASLVGGPRKHSHRSSPWAHLGFWFGGLWRPGLKKPISTPVLLPSTLTPPSRPIVRETSAIASTPPSASGYEDDQVR